MAPLKRAFSQFISLCRDNRAIAAIEFALVIPVFLLFFLGIMELFIVLFGNTIVNNMAAQASRRAMVGCIDREITAGTCRNNFLVDVGELRRMIRLETAGMVKACDTNKLRINVSRFGSGNGGLGQGGQLVTFDIQYEWDSLFPVLKKALPKLMNFQTVFIVRNEQFGNLSRSVNQGC